MFLIFFDVFRLGLWAFEKDTTEVKCPSNHIILGSTC